MSLSTFRSLWGMASTDWEIEFPILKANGFYGIEASLADVGLPEDQSQFLRFCNLIHKYQLKWICGLYTGWTDYAFGTWKTTSIADHIDQFKDQIEILLSLEKDQLPIHVNCHTGCDSFTEDQAIELFNVILNMEKKLKIPVSHETHRGRILGSPWVCLRLIEKYKDLRITLDISHWNVVSERLISIDVIKEVFSRVDHIHARIGTHESPQVGNPRAKYSEIFTEYHETLWKTIWKSGLASGKEIFTITPEYGPAQDYYMPQIALTGEDGMTQQYVERELSNLIIDEKQKLEELFTDCNI